MWFIFTLFILFLFYPLYKFSLKKPAYTVLFFFVAVLLNLLFPKNISFLCLTQVAKYMIFFYAGILISKYEFYKKLDSWLIFAVFLIVFACSWMVNAPQIIIAFAGIVASFSLCLCVAHRLPNLFSSFRNYTFQIFLIGIFPQMAVRFLFAKTTGIIPYNTTYILLYITSILVALYIPVLIELFDYVYDLFQCVGIFVDQYKVHVRLVIAFAEGFQVRNFRELVNIISGFPTTHSGYHLN